MTLAIEIFKVRISKISFIKIGMNSGHENERFVTPLDEIWIKSTYYTVF